MKKPIPDEVLDDRLFWGGTSGSGKSYNAMGRVERLLKRRARGVIVDPLGVWWGLRLLADGVTPSGLDVVIFGGKHGDLPLTEHAGALLAETVVGMKESCILDLSQLGTKAAERRFMLDFLSVLYRQLDGTPLHVIFDEADIFAPQSLVGDKDGPAPRLLGMMETVVRRGRVKGFIPWLISQRPAVLNKNVLSQADGIVAFKLTASQDRDAIAAWVEGQADKATWRAMYGELATAQTGEGLVWVPARRILERVQFPAKETFDSTRTPKRGEKAVHRDLQPIDLGALRERLAKVEVEVKANDPRTLKARIRELEAAARASAPAVDDAALTAARAAGFSAGVETTWAFFHLHIATHGDRLRSTLDGLVSLNERDKPKALNEAHTAKPAPVVHRRPPPAFTVNPQPRKPPPIEAAGITRPQQRILDGLAWLESVSITSADRTRVAWLADASPKSSAFMNNLGALSSRGLIAYPRPGEVAFTEAGRAAANPVDAPLDDAALHSSIRAKLPRPQWAIVEQCIAAYPDPLSRDELAKRAGASATSSAFMNNLGALRALGLIDYPQQGHVAATDILFVER